MTVGKMAGNFINNSNTLFKNYSFIFHSIDDIGWIAKLHLEAIQRKKLTKVLFPTKLCQEIDYCQKSELSKKREEEIDAPYW